MINYDSDSLYPDVIREINNKYNIDGLEANTEIIISDSIQELFTEAIKGMKIYNIIDRETHQLNLERYSIFRDYIARKSPLKENNITCAEIINLITKLDKMHWNNKQVGSELCDLGFEGVPNEYRFYSYSKLDIWSMILYHGMELYNCLTEVAGINNGIIFNKESGEVYLDKQRLGKINICTHPFMFFEFLYDNIGSFKSHQEIKEYIKGNDQLGKSDSAFCIDIKRLLEPKIKKLIERNKGGYIINKV